MNSRPVIHQQIICANVFVHDNGHYLLLKRSPLKTYAPNYIHPFGGKVDRGENPLEAAVREVTEETGLKLKNIRLRAVILELQPEKDEPYDWMIYHFMAEPAGGSVQLSEEGEPVWLDKRQVLEADLFPSVKLTIEHILGDNPSPVFATVHYKTGHEITSSTLSICGLSA